jgi:hypothetical protein
LAINRELLKAVKSQILFIAPPMILNGLNASLTFKLTEKFDSYLQEQTLNGGENRRLSKNKSQYLDDAAKFCTICSFRFEQLFDHQAEHNKQTETTISDSRIDKNRADASERFRRFNGYVLVIAKAYASTMA